LKAKGIDLNVQTVKEEFLKRKTIIFIDDAQSKYYETEFWPLLIKSTGLWLPRTVKFIISASHSFHGGKESPVEFVNFQDLTFFLLMRKLFNFSNLKVLVYQRI
jgi:hypothetical protein